MKRPKPASGLAKHELIIKAQEALAQHFQHDPRPAVEYLLEQFSAWDLEAILADLKNKKRHEG